MKELAERRITRQLAVCLCVSLRHRFAKYIPATLRSSLPGAVNSFETIDSADDVSHLIVDAPDIQLIERRTGMRAQGLKIFNGRSGEVEIVVIHKDNFEPPLPVGPDAPQTDVSGNERLAVGAGSDGQQGSPELSDLLHRRLEVTVCPLAVLGDVEGCFQILPVASIPDAGRPVDAQDFIKTSVRQPPGIMA